MEGWKQMMKYEGMDKVTDSEMPDDQHGPSVTGTMCMESNQDDSSPPQNKINDNDGIVSGKMPHMGTSMLVSPMKPPRTKRQKYFQERNRISTVIINPTQQNISTTHPTITVLQPNHGIVRSSARPVYQEAVNAIPCIRQLDGPHL